MNTKKSTAPPRKPIATVAFVLSLLSAIMLVIAIYLWRTHSSLPDSLTTSNVVCAILLGLIGFVTSIIAYRRSTHQHKNLVVISLVLSSFSAFITLIVVGFWILFIFASSTVGK